MYSDGYSVGDKGTFTVLQQFFVDRGQVKIFWPTDTGSTKTWYGSWDQNATVTAPSGAIIHQNNPDLQNGATCILYPQDQHGCSPIQANNTN
jgi:hypothetical protein